MPEHPEHVPMPDPFAVGALLPHPHAADPGRDATRWGAALAVTAPALDQGSPWSAPAAGPPGVGGLAAVEPEAWKVREFRDRTRPAAESPGAA